MTRVDGEHIGLTFYIVSFVGTDDLSLDNAVIPAKDYDELELLLDKLIENEKSALVNRLSNAIGVIIFKIDNLQIVNQGALDKFSKSHDNIVVADINETNKDLN